jgi:hypothetical protein
LPLLINEILIGVPVDAKHRIKIIVDRYRERVRDAVKDAVLLSLGGRGRPRHSILVELRDGAPRIVSETLFHDDLGAALTAYRGTLAASAECLTLLRKVPDQLSEDIRLVYLGQYPASAAEDVERFLLDMGARIDHANVVPRILEIDEDYLGLYEPSEQSGTIAIYWGMIALCASRLGVSMEALALKVLVHEYAHALSHLGMDANGNHWELGSFSCADRFVQEGLANYFSWCVLKSSDDWWMQEALRAFEAIWPLQPPPYGEFEIWRRSIEVSQETVMSALRKARQISKVARGEFQELLKH